MATDPEYVPTLLDYAAVIDWLWEERHDTKLKHSTYGSDEYKGFLAGMGEGLAHHYASNRHHPEHHAAGVEGMNLIDLVEMICDWLAATKRHADGDIRRSIDVNQERFGYDDQVKRILHNTVDVLLGGSV